MWMMVLEALLDVNMTLVNFDTNSSDLSLKRKQNIYHLSKASIIEWRRRSSLRGRGSCMLITLYWRRLMCLVLILKLNMSIRLHESLTTKSILNSHLGLSLSNIRQRMETDLCDKARKRKTCSMLISHLKHDL
jgi:hypothetical protein